MSENNKSEKRKDIGAPSYHFWFGLLSGIVILYTVTYLYRTYWLKDFIISDISVSKNSDTSKISLIQSVEQLRVSHTIFIEKLEAVNKRLDDFLLFGGMIITLLLAISISVYIRTESEVSKYMRTYSKDIEKEIEMKKEAIQKNVDKTQDYLAEAVKINEQLKLVLDTAKKNVDISKQGKQS